MGMEPSGINKTKTKTKFNALVVAFKVQLPITVSNTLDDGAIYKKIMMK